MNNPSTAFVLSFILTVAAVAIGITVAIHWTGARTRSFPPAVTLIAFAGWLLITGVLASAGLLWFDALPPTMFVLVVTGIVLTVLLARSRVGTALAQTLPLGVIVGFQVFRVPVELLLHRAYGEGLAPVQMTFEGFNFDIVSGITGGLFGFFLLRTRYAPRWLLLAWNILGLTLLATIVTIAILSAPVPFRVFMQEPANVWVTTWPWVWLPTVFVPAALFFHLLLFRRIRLTMSTQS